MKAIYKVGILSIILISFIATTFFHFSTRSSQGLPQIFSKASSVKQLRDWRTPGRGWAPVAISPYKTWPCVKAIPSLLECKRTCIETESCAWIQWDERANLCFLREGCVHSSSIFHQTNEPIFAWFPTDSYRCDSQSCTYRSAIITAPSNKTQHGVSARECAILCEEIRECHYFSWMDKKDGKCHLHFYDISPTPPMRFRSHTLSGAKNCPLDFRIGNNHSTPITPPCTIFLQPTEMISNHKMCFVDQLNGLNIERRIIRLAAILESSRLLHRIPIVFADEAESFVRLFDINRLRKFYQFYFASENPSYEQTACDFPRNIHTKIGNHLFCVRQVIVPNEIIQKKVEFAALSVHLNVGAYNPNIPHKTVQSCEDHQYRRVGDSKFLCGGQPIPRLYVERILHEIGALKSVTGFFARDSPFKRRFVWYSVGGDGPEADIEELWALSQFSILFLPFHASSQLVIWSQLVSSFHLIYPPHTFETQFDDL